MHKLVQAAADAAAKKGVQIKAKEVIKAKPIKGMAMGKGR